MPMTHLPEIGAKIWYQTVFDASGMQFGDYQI